MFLNSQITALGFLKHLLMLGVHYLKFSIELFFLNGNFLVELFDTFSVEIADYCNFD